MNLLENLLYGFISGASSFIPVSSYGHQTVFRQIIGQAYRNPLTDLFVHLAIVLALWICCNTEINMFIKGFSNKRYRSRSRNMPVDRTRTYEIRLLITASVAMLAVQLFCTIAHKTESNLLLTCLFFICNGVVLYITEHVRQSNKEARHMTGLNAIVMGLFSGLGIFPGISRVGAGMSMAIMQGADKSKALKWMLIISVPAVSVLACFDFVNIFTATGFSFSFIALLGGLLSAAGAFLGAYTSILLMRFVIVNSGFVGFACYSWGMAMLTFILYLIA